MNKQAPDSTEFARLQAAVNAGEVTEVRRLLASGVSTPSEVLARAASCRQTALIQALLQDGANVHHRDDLPLRSAAKCPETLKVLLEAGANVHAANDDALWRVVSLAYLEGRDRKPNRKWLECARLLMAHSANPLAAHPLAHGNSILEHQSRPVKLWSRRSGRYPEFPAWAGDFVEILVNSLPELSASDAKRVRHFCNWFPEHSFNIRLTDEARQQMDIQRKASSKREATRARNAATKLSEEISRAQESLLNAPMPANWIYQVCAEGVILKGPYLQELVVEFRLLKGKWDPHARQWTVALRKAAKLFEALGRLASRAPGQH
jgi:hypothetical protein